MIVTRLVVAALIILGVVLFSVGGTVPCLLVAALVMIDNIMDMVGKIQRESRGGG
jgi:hypothetical protein